MMGRDPRRSPRQARATGPRTLALGVEAAEALRTSLRAIAGEVPPHARRIRVLLGRDASRRARLLLLSADMAAARPTVRALRLATAVELIHAGSLCCDDVVDRTESKRRRQRGNASPPSPLALARLGLFLLVRGGALVASEPTPVRVAVVRAVREVGRERAAGIAAPGGRRRAGAKAGALSGLAGRLGAFAASLPVPVGDAIVCLATEVGLGLQLAEDRRDLETEAGESLALPTATVTVRDGVLPVAAIAEAHRRWTRAARTAPTYTVGLGEALLAVVAEVDGSAADALRIGLLDLLVGDFFALLARLRAAEAVWASNVLALRLRNALVAAPS